MQKNVQISYDLFMALVRYHCLHDDSQTDMIRAELEDKVNAMARRQAYSEQLRKEPPKDD